MINREEENNSNNNEAQVKPVLEALGKISIIVVAWTAENDREFSSGG